MELAICSFASSSAGNSFLIQSQSTRILADIGISAKKTEESLAACGLSCVELDGIVLTKLDGTAKGGIAFGIVRELKTPVMYVGVGEGIEDLQAFDAKEFVDALFD